MLAAGGWHQLRPLDPAAVQCARFDIAGFGYAMQVPKDSGVERSANGDTVTIVPKPGSRLVHVLWLSRHTAPTLEPPEVTTTFGSGTRIEYSVDKDIGGGSGGTEAELYGELFFEGQSALLVGCRDQKEGTPDPEWCVAYLETLHRQHQAGACQ